MSDIQDAPLIDVETLKTKLEETKAAQAGSDRKYQEEAKKTKQLQEENELLKGRIGQEADIIRRLDKIYKTFEQREAEREIQFYSKIACLDQKIPYKLIENESFSDRDAVDSRLAQISETLEQMKIDEINGVLQKSSQPRGGDFRPPERNVKDMSMSELNELFKMGQLK